MKTAAAILLLNQALSAATLRRPLTSSTLAHETNERGIGSRHAEANIRPDPQRSALLSLGPPGLRPVGAVSLSVLL
jgi:hypothetical protein